MNEAFDIQAEAIRNIKNSKWKINDVCGQYSDANPHADLYRYINLWTDTQQYLNVGYSDRLHRHMHVSSHLRLIDRLAEGLLELHNKSPYKNEHELIDIGSGRGGAANRAWEKYALEVTGVDLTPYNLGLATENAEKKGIGDHVRFILGDAHDLPFQDASFPLGWSIESPAHFANKPLFLRELCRVIRPGGAAALSDLLAVSDVVLQSKENTRIYEDFLSVWDVPNLETFEGYKEIFAEAGFRLKRTEIVTRCNLDIFRKYIRIFLILVKSNWLYTGYRRYIKWRCGANIDNVYEHTLLSLRALNLHMIDYGLFWAVKE